MPPLAPLLILVHPGSLCGSLAYNLGSQEARSIRESIVNQLERWEGPLFVLDGELSDELPSYPLLDKAIRNAVERNPGSQRLEAEDPDHVGIAMAWCKGLPRSTPIALTGAWYDPSNRSGCVNATQEGLTKMGFESVTILDEVAVLDFYSEGEEPSP